MNEFFTWELLATYAGAVTAVGGLTQLIKNSAILKKIPTQLVSYLLALSILIAAEAVRSTLTFSSCALSLINAAFISLASNGAYTAVAKKADGA